MIFHRVIRYALFSLKMLFFILRQPLKTLFRDCLSITNDSILRSLPQNKLFFNGNREKLLVFRGSLKKPYPSVEIINAKERFIFSFCFLQQRIVLSFLQPLQ